MSKKKKDDEEEPKMTIQCGDGEPVEVTPEQLDEMANGVLGIPDISAPILRYPLHDSGSNGQRQRCDCQVRHF